MKRFDLRHLKDDFYNRMIELVNSDIKVDEVGIFLFEVGDFTTIQKSADTIKADGHELMNSLKFNEVDWTVVVKRSDAQAQKQRQEEYKKAKAEAEAQAKIAQAEALAKEEAARVAAEAKASTTEEEAK